jgi:hypothetical protein
MAQTTRGRSATGDGNGSGDALSVGFSATERRRAREGRSIEVGGSIYRPAAKTNETMRKLLELQADANEMEEAIREKRAAAERAEDESRWEAAAELRTEARGLESQMEFAALDAVYAQLAVLLREEDGGENPDPAKLGEVLDIEDARALLDYLMPGVAEGN